MRLTRNNLATSFTVLLLHVGLLSIVNKTAFDLYARAAIYLYAILTLLYFVIKRNKEKWMLVIICGTTAYMILSTIFVGGGIGSVLTFSVAMMVLNMTTEVKFSIAQRRELSFLCEGILIYVFIYSIKYISNWRYYLLNDINPNTLGMYLMFTFMLWDNLQCINKKKRYLIQYMLLAFLSLKGMYNLQSRGTMAALIVFIVLKMIPPRLFKSNIMFTATLALMTICIAFPFLFLNLYRKGFEFVLMGKSLYTGRENIWSSMFELLNSTKGAWLVGLGSRAQIRTNHSQNIHNDYFATIVNFGLIGFTLHLLYIVKYLKLACDSLRLNHDAKKWLSMFIASVVLLGATETVTHWAAIFIFSYLSLGIAANNKTTEGDGR